MKLTTVTMVTVDGVMQGLGGPEENRGGGFQRGGWQGPLWDDEAGEALNRIYERADAFLFGRWTYDHFAPYWGSITDPNHRIAVALNSKPKYLASTTVTEPAWPETTVLGVDLATAVADLKAEPGGELQVHGSGALIRRLLDTGLVDEIILFVCPVILGQGTRLFAETGPDVALDLVESRATPKGITIQVYRPAGRPRYARADEM